MKDALEFSEKDFSTPAWLYQMSSGGSGGLWTDNQNKPWYPSSYRQDVIEGQSVIWNVGKIYLRNQGPVSKDDTVIFFFCKSGEIDPKTRTFQPGIYGWGKIITPPQLGHNEIEFVARPPSDYLKIKVLWDKDINRIINEIRVRQYQGTMWPIGQNHMQEIRRKIFAHMTKVK
jgi:hypothetical protein